jgi:hypothetical protein
VDWQLRILYNTKVNKANSVKQSCFVLITTTVNIYFLSFKFLTLKYGNRCNQRYECQCNPIYCKAVERMQDYWVFGLCPSSSILKTQKNISQKLNALQSSRSKRHQLQGLFRSITIIILVYITSPITVSPSLIHRTMTVKSGGLCWKYLWNYHDIQ